MPSIPPSHIEMYLSLEVERPGLRGSFQIGGLEGATKCSCGDCFGDIRCDGNFSEFLESFYVWIEALSTAHIEQKKMTLKFSLFLHSKKST
ncbi:hypothetical protein TNCV_164982 [Trichonephila clavipes]|nr:hypothetical protein TNCV_164982 [Trichonephila clavipes]